MEINLFANQSFTRPIIDHKTMPIKLKAELYDPRVVIEDPAIIEARYYLPKGYYIANNKICSKSKPKLKNQI
jgi:hypothetical protein